MVAILDEIGHKTYNLLGMLYLLDIRHSTDYSFDTDWLRYVDYYIAVRLL